MAEWTVIISAIAPTIAALAAWRKSSQTKKEVESPNGMRAGLMIAENYRLIKDHISDNALHISQADALAGRVEDHISNDDRHMSQEPPGVG